MCARLAICHQPPPLLCLLGQQRHGNQQAVCGAKCVDGALAACMPYRGMHALPWHACMHAGGRWAEPSEGELRRTMRRVVERPGEAAARGRLARQLVQERFSTERVARALGEQLQRAAGEALQAAAAGSAAA